MTAKIFYNKVANGKKDIVQVFLDALNSNKIPYCLIGGLAVNAYAEPVISLDVDMVVAVENLELLLSVLPKQWTVKKDRFSINISSNESDLRIQIQTDVRYQSFVKRAVNGSALGYEFKVASIEDVMQGKLWAYTDPERRATKRQKDQLDIMRLLESHQELLSTPIGALANKSIAK